MFNYFTGKIEAFDVEMGNSSSELIDYFLKRSRSAAQRGAQVERLLAYQRIRRVERRGVRYCGARAAEAQRRESLLCHVMIKTQVRRRR